MKNPKKWKRRMDKSEEQLGREQALLDLAKRQREMKKAAAELKRIKKQRALEAKSKKAQAYRDSKMV